MTGIFGVVSKEDCYETLIYGTDYHSHLGTEFGGVAVLGENFAREIHNISQSQFKAKFAETGGRPSGQSGIGVISDRDEQPVYLNSRLGEFCLVTSGYIDNAEELAEKVMRNGFGFAEMSKGAVNLTELAAKLILRGDTIVSGIEHIFDAIEGSCSLLLLHRSGLYAARDRRGYNPLVVGQREDALAVSSETCAFPNNGFAVVKYLAPGEIVALNQDGLTQIAPGRKASQFCSFLWVYTGFPASDYEGINTEVVRENCGRQLARHDRDLEVDQVCGIPDSGIAHAVGYAMESGRPFRRPLVKYTPGYGRSYTPPSQKTRDLVATMKLIAIKQIADGQRIVVCEDSIVRGTQLKNFTVKKLWESGAREVHVRPACPPLMFPCRFNLSTRTAGELVARRAVRALEGRDPEDLSAYLNPDTPQYQLMVDWIARDLEVTTLRYQRIDDLVEAIGLPREKLCLYCWNGQCPAAEGAKVAGCIAPPAQAANA